MRSKELGPLWEQGPKLNGFRLAIPEPWQLYSYIVETSKKSGDLIPEERSRRFEEFHLGLAKDPMSREWVFDINDTLLERVEITLMASYSSISGEWGDIYASIWMQKEKSWEVVAKQQKILKNLTDKGFNPTLRKDEIEIHELLIPGKGKETVVWALGFENLEKALRLDSRATEFGNNPLIIRLDNLYPSFFIEFLKKIQLFQHSTTSALDSLYEVFNLQPPNLTFELSILKEDLH